MQVVATVLSLDPEIDSDIPSLIGASARCRHVRHSVHGPIGAARVGYKNGNYLLNPTATQVKTESDLDLVVAGTEDAVLMVESEAKGLSEDVMLGAVLFGHEQMQVAIDGDQQAAGRSRQAALGLEAAGGECRAEAGGRRAVGQAFADAYGIVVKQARVARLAEIRQAVQAALSGGEKPQFTRTRCRPSCMISNTDWCVTCILSGQAAHRRPRPQDRAPDPVEVGALPRTHGSAIFTRGETQALVTATLGTGRDAQIIDALAGERREPFMLHYNFPPFSVGETGFMGSPKRREIGHGNLARRGIIAVMPDLETFPVRAAGRVRSPRVERFELHGDPSAAPASSLMDAGVPIKAPVAGVAMGLVKEGDKFAVLTDILGDEDHLGDMDFKVAGTATASPRCRWTSRSTASPPRS